MSEEQNELISRIRGHSKSVTSYKVRVESSVTFGPIHLDSKGTMVFLSPDRFRSDTLVNEEESVTIRIGSEIKKYVPARKEVWRYSQGSPQSAELIGYTSMDLRDPFPLFAGGNPKYEGVSNQEGFAAFAFYGKAKEWTPSGLLDTRKGFSISLPPKVLKVGIRLFIDTETFLLRRMNGYLGQDRVIFQSLYTYSDISLPVDESLFQLDERALGFKVHEISSLQEDILRVIRDPDSAETASSLN
jgi:outer membrane lipoprotein-sorting protein